MEVGKSFNPTMVRLLLGSGTTMLAAILQFQSHNGAIAAILITLLTKIFAMFQSHNGAIAARSTRTQSSMTTAVSIPQWCDCCLCDYQHYQHAKSCFNPTMVRLLLERRRNQPVTRPIVSIPQWCDCCLNAWRCPTPARQFQSHNGAIAASPASFCS